MKNEHDEYRLLEALELLLFEECSKPYTQIDVDYVIECVNFILELKGKDIILTEEEIRERVTRIPFQ